MTVMVREPEPTVENRESWLIRAGEALAEWFREHDLEVPPFRVSVGWPGGRGPKQNVRGQCWPTPTAGDGVAQVFISPRQADTVTTLAVLLHEMVHVVDDCKHGHAKDFIVFARALGFTSKWTSSDNRTDGLTERLAELAEVLGDYPSAAIVGGGGGGGLTNPTVQKTRMIKAECSGGTGYKVRLTQKWIDEYGAPFCPCCMVEMEIL